MSIATVLVEDRLIRGAWSREEDGRQLLCLFTALVGDPTARPDECPASLCPQWLAHLLVWLDDAPSEAAWPGIVARVARLAPRFPDLAPEVEWRVRALCVREAIRHTDRAAVLTRCEHVAVLCERRGRSEAVPDEEMALAALAAARAPEGALATAAAAQAASLSERAVARAALAAEAAEAAWAAWAAWVEAGAAGATPAASLVAADHLATAILDEIERALEVAA